MAHDRVDGDTLQLTHEFLGGRELGHYPTQREAVGLAHLVPGPTSTAPAGSSPQSLGCLTSGFEDRKASIDIAPRQRMATKSVAIACISAMYRCASAKFALHEDKSAKRTVSRTKAKFGKINIRG